MVCVHVGGCEFRSAVGQIQVSSAKAEVGAYAAVQSGLVVGYAVDSLRLRNNESLGVFVPHGPRQVDNLHRPRLHKEVVLAIVSCL